MNFIYVEEELTTPSPFNLRFYLSCLLNQQVLKKIFLLFLFSTICFFSKAQIDSCNLRISLLTCTPGKELYSTFGHSAIRVVDSSNGSDIIFNYGTFDFEDPDFYKKFILGKLLYFVSVDQFSDFVQQYQYEQRGIIEQTLNLSCAEKENLLVALYENAKEENKYYKYDFVYDNCTTRLRDMVASYCMDHLTTKNILPHKGITFRNLIHEYLDRGGQYWSKLGIDILLGKPVDKKIINKEAMFLPDYLLKAFDSTSFGGKKLVSAKKTILVPATGTEKNVLLTPLLIFCFLFLVAAGISLFRSAGFNLILRTFDNIFFFLCGAVGWLILFLWFGTEHQACRSNFNLLWALPTHLPAAFLLFKKSDWLKKYFRFTFWLNILLLLVWFFLPQQMNIALLPVVGILGVRSFFLSKMN